MNEAQQKEVGKFDDLNKFGKIVEMIKPDTKFKTNDFYKALHDISFDEDIVEKMTDDIKSRYPGAAFWHSDRWEWSVNLLGTNTLVAHAHLPKQGRGSEDDTTLGGAINRLADVERHVTVQFELDYSDDQVKISKVIPTEMTEDPAMVRIADFIKGAPYYGAQKGSTGELQPEQYLIPAIVKAAWDGEALMKDFDTYLKEEYPAVNFWEEETKWVPHRTKEALVLELIGTNSVGFEYKAKFLLSSKDGVVKLERVAPKIYEPLNGHPIDRKDLDTLLAMDWVDCQRDTVLPLISRVVTSQDRLSGIAAEIARRITVQGLPSLQYEIHFGQVAVDNTTPVFTIRFRVKGHWANQLEIKNVVDQMVLKYQLQEVNGKVYLGMSFPGNAEPVVASQGYRGAAARQAQAGFKDAGLGRGMPSGYPGAHEGTYEARPIFSHPRMGMRGEMPYGDMRWGAPEAWRHSQATQGPMYGYGRPNEISVQFMDYAEIEHYIEMLVNLRPVHMDQLLHIQAMVDQHDIANNPHPPRQHYFNLSGNWSMGVPIDCVLRIASLDLASGRPVSEYTLHLFN